MPMISQMMRRNHVSPGKERISQNAESMPAIGVKGTHGVLNGRGISGRLRRSTQTPAQTITKASSVPMLTNSPRIPIGISAAKNATKIPTMMVDFHGVRNFGWISPAHFQRKPSRDMEEN